MPCSEPAAPMDKENCVAASSALEVDEWSSCALRCVSSAAVAAQSAVLFAVICDRCASWR